MQSVGKAMDSANAMLDDPDVRDSFKRQMKDAPEMVKDVREAAIEMKQTLALADEDLRDIRHTTEPLGKKAGPILDNMEEITGQLKKFSVSLNGTQGTLGQLIHNPQLYHRLDCTTANIDRMVRDLRPVLDDLRVFSDKIARHPETLGVRGFVERSSGIK